MTVVDATARFARRTAEACMSLWDRNATIAAVQRLGEEHEEEIVRQIEQLQIERLQREEE